jgi:magnesium chelatase family protein
LSSIAILPFEVPDQKVIVNLSPAEQKKNGPMFELAMAVGLLGATDAVKAKIKEDTGFIGALSLDGSSGHSDSPNFVDYKGWFGFFVGSIENSSHCLQS